MRVSILFGRLAVGRPPRVPDADHAVQGFGREGLLQIHELADIVYTQVAEYGTLDSLVDMAESVLLILGKAQNLLRYVKDRPGHDRRYGVNASKLRQEIGWQPTIDLDTGLRTTIDWYCHERSWWERIKSGEYRKFYDELYSERLEYGSRMGERKS